VSCVTATLVVIMMAVTFLGVINSVRSPSYGRVTPRLADSMPPVGKLLWPVQVESRTSDVSSWAKTDFVGQYRALKWKVGSGEGSILVAIWDRPVHLMSIGMAPVDTSMGPRSLATARRITAVRYSFGEGSQKIARFQDPGPRFQWTRVNIETKLVRIEVLETRNIPEHGGTVISELRFGGFPKLFDRMRSTRNFMNANWGSRVID
jgi:hypothetical protein